MQAASDILLAGNPQLKTASKRVNSKYFHSKELANLIDLLFAKMAETNGAGLAAIQIGVPLKVIVYGFKDNPRYPNEGPIPQTVILNPEIVKKSDAMVKGYEGCLSLPNIRGEVQRHEWIEIQGLDDKGELIHKTISGFEARIVQHEIDHTDGILFPERMTDMRTLGVTSALKDAGIIP